MTDIFARIIDHPSAWTKRSVGSVDRFAVRLSEAQLAALDDILGRTRHLQPQQVTRQDFAHPALDGFLDDVLDIILHGSGVVIIKGVTPARYSEEDFERIYWGFGTHWGKAATQSAFGDRLGHVRHEKENPNGRKYRGTGEIPPHTDFYEVMGLMSVQKGAAGGYSQIVSGLAIHNEIFNTRPDLLGPLYRGFRYASPEASTTSSPITDYEVPVFSCVDGQVSCAYIRAFVTFAARKLGVEVPADLTEALDYFDSLSQREDMRFEFLLEPGEMLICNNLVTLHARTPFEDAPGNTRHLLRLWLEIENGRPVIPALVERAREYGRANV